MTTLALHSDVEQCSVEGEATNWLATMGTVGLVNAVALVVVFLCVPDFPAFARPNSWLQFVIGE